MSSRKKKTKKQSLEVTPNPSLPDDLLLSCFARVSKMYYPTLSLVSKRCRSLIASPELYKTRSFLNHTESCLYICLQFPDEPNQRWFTLCRKPNQTQTNNNKKKSSGYVLAPVPVPNSPTVNCKCLVAVGSNIYAIGRSNRHSSSVSILDCRSHKWQEAPSMRIERNCAAATNVVDGRIYVAGGLEEEDCNDSNWMEVFDTKTQTWELLVTPLAERRTSRIGRSAVIEGEIYLFGYTKSVAYKPKEAKWIPIQNLNVGIVHPYCVVDNVMYFYFPCEIHRYDPAIRNWIKLMGLEGLPKFASYSHVKLAACGGKLIVLWDKNVPASGYKEKMIWCAEISLEKRNSKEIWGKVEWFDAVLRVPKSYNFVGALAATV